MVNEPATEPQSYLLMLCGIGQRVTIGLWDRYKHILYSSITTAIIFIYCKYTKTQQGNKLVCFCLFTFFPSVTHTIMCCLHLTTRVHQGTHTSPDEAGRQFNGQTDMWTDWLEKSYLYVTCLVTLLTLGILVTHFKDISSNYKIFPHHCKVIRKQPSYKGYISVDKWENSWLMHHIFKVKLQIACKLKPNPAYLPRNFIHMNWYRLVPRNWHKSEIKWANQANWRNVNVHRWNIVLFWPYICDRNFSIISLWS